MGKKTLGDFEVGGCSGVKRIKYRSDSDKADDNFVVVLCCRASTKRACKAIIESENDDPEEGSDQRRVSPKWLVAAMRNMNPLQKKVEELMGFGQLFHLQVDYVPAKIVSITFDLH